MNTIAKKINLFLFKKFSDIKLFDENLFAILLSNSKIYGKLFKKLSSTTKLIAGTINAILIVSKKVPIIIKKIK